MKNLKNSILFKVAVIIILILLLLIPTAMVQNIIREREMVQQGAIEEVSAKWGNGQTLVGPYISIPYYKYIKQFSSKDSVDKIVRVKDWIYILPEQLNFEGAIYPEKRHRGIYDVVVYGSEISISGSFNAIDLKSFEIDWKNVDLENASLNIGITDLRGIDNQIELQWNTDKSFFNAGLSTRDLCSSGIHSLVKLSNSDSSVYNFAFDVQLKGSQHLYFTPVGKTSDVKLTSNWTTPSFTGFFLPDSPDVDENGFMASWNILHLNRNYPQSWVGNHYNLSESTFGTDLLLPVDNYKKSHRVARYAILFLSLTFMVFFFVEVLQQVFIHPIQYLLVGIALVVFYSLLLAISEHMSFNYAYMLSAILTLALITTYTGTILKSKRIALLIFGILLILYTFIFTIIQLEDYALLMGSIGMFLILSIVMYFSRKIDWYAIRIGD